MVIFSRPDFATSTILPESVAVEGRPVLHILGLPVSFGADVDADGFEDLVALIRRGGFAPSRTNGCHRDRVGRRWHARRRHRRGLPPPDSARADAARHDRCRRTTTAPPTTTAPRHDRAATTTAPPTTTAPAGECDLTQEARNVQILGRVLDAQGQPHIGHVVLRDRALLVGSILGQTSANEAGFFELNAPTGVVVSPGCDASYVIEVDSVSEDGSTDLFGELDVTSLVTVGQPGGEIAVDLRSTPIRLNAVGQPDPTVPPEPSVP